ncbi:MAG: protein kinase [Rhodothermaceae bacterium]|nr:protein kinase [Rhodothermaceae bacterium]
MQRPDSAIGKIIDGYKILDVLGQGGMGIVYKAEDVALSRQVALKMINPDLASQDTFLRRFQLEAKALARVDSPYIVGVHALRKAGEHVFIVMEYVDGWTLSDEMNNGTLDSKRAYSVLKQLLQAFSHAHGVGVVHRDIKPSNIMISREGRVKVTDFGLAKLRREDGMTTVTQGIAGTARYMSPEQVLGKKIDHRSDIYSLGMTLYHMFAGKLPFEPDEGTYSILRRVVEEEFAEVSQINAKIPRALSEVITKAIAKSPDDRYQTADEMLAALEIVFDDGQTKEGDPVSVRPQTRSERSKKPLVFAAIALCVILIYPVYSFVSNRGGDSNGESPQTNQPDPAANQANTTLDGQDSLSAAPESIYAYPTINTNPSGASVLINGQSYGATPVRGLALEAGTVEITIALEGYETMTRSETLAAGSIREISFDLRQTNIAQVEPVRDDPPPVITQPQNPTPSPAMGTLRLSANPSGLIYVNNELFDNNSDQLKEIGSYTVSFVAANNPEIKKDTTFSLLENEQVNITGYFERKLTIALRCTNCGNGAVPPANININGSDAGYTPMGAQPYPAGDYTVQILDPRLNMEIANPTRQIRLLPVFEEKDLIHKEFFNVTISRTQ